MPASSWKSESQPSAVNDEVFALKLDGKMVGGIAVAFEHRDLMALAQQDARQVFADFAAAHDNDIHRSLPLHHVNRERIQQVMANACQHAVAMVEHAVARGNGTHGAVATLKRDNANAMIAFKVAHLHAAAGRHRQVDGEAKHLKVAERIEMASVA